MGQNQNAFIVESQRLWLRLPLSFLCGPFLTSLVCLFSSGVPCFLKTGIKDGPSKNKSFYVCGVQGQPPCGFVLPTQYVEHSYVLE